MTFGVKWEQIKLNLHLSQISISHTKQQRFLCHSYWFSPHIQANPTIFDKGKLFLESERGRKRYIDRTRSKPYNISSKIWQERYSKQESIFFINGKNKIKKFQLVKPGAQLSIFHLHICTLILKILTLPHTPGHTPALSLFPFFLYFLTTLNRLKLWSYLVTTEWNSQGLKEAKGIYMSGDCFKLLHI